MRNYITLNGKNSNEINGLLIQELPPISKPQIRTEVEEIDGRDGDIVTKLGFAAYDKEFTVGLYKDFDINAIIAYFNSEGTVVFSNEPDKYYNYQIIDQIDFERLVRYRTATVRMHCQPFKYSNTESARTLGNKGTASDEGSYITLDNTPEAQFSKIEPKGNAEQTTYSGKNLMPLEPYRFGYYYGTSVGTQVEYDVTSAASQVTFTPKADGTSTITITASWRGVWFMSQALTAGTYYLNLNGATTTGNLGASVYAMDSDHKITRVILNTTATPITNQLQMAITLAEGETYISVGIGVRTTAGTNTLGTLMLSAGSTATAYEPYVGGTASPNPDYPQPISVVTGENVVKIEGKNLFDKDMTPVGAWHATKETTQSGLKLTSTASGGVCYVYYEFPFKHSESVDATMSFQKTGTGFVNIYFRDKDNNATKSISNQTSTFSLSGIPSTTTKVQIYFYGDTSAVGKVTTYDNIQLELGSTATAYEPYQGQRYEINLGKNLLPMIDGTATIRGITATIADGVLTLNGTSTGSGIFKLTNGIEGAESLAPSASWLTEKFPITNLNGTNIAIDYQSGTSPQASSAFRLYGSTTTYTNQWYPLTSDQATTWTNNTQAPSCLCFFFANGITFNNYKITLQIERGSTATSFAPYFTPIELAKIGNYQDRIYKEDSKWYIEKQVGKVVYDGSETWISFGVGVNSYRIDLSNLANSPITEPLVMSNYFYGISHSNRTMTGQFLMYSDGDTANRLVVRNTTWTSLADFKTWLSSDPTTVYYALAEPVDEEITNETLISQLEALYNQAHAYKGRTHVAAIAQGSNAPHIIEAEVQRSSDGNITNNGNIVSKPTLTIYGSGNIGVSLNGYQIFEITLGDEEYITIDTAAMEAYKDTLDNLKNRLVNGDYSKFALRPGSNMIEFSGTVSKCVISKYSRWL